MKAKKYLGLSAAFVLGIFVATVGEDVSAQVNSMIGKKVTGEYNIIVNGETLSDKGAVIDGRANVPVRALSESLGADIKVENKTIVVTAEETGVGDKVVTIDGKYYDKYDLLNEKKKLEDNLVIFRNNLEREEGKSEQMESVTGIVKDLWVSGISTLKEKIRLTNEQLSKINEALKAFE